MLNGKSLTHIRIFNELSRAELAKEIGVSEQAIWQYENDYVNPSLDVINKLKRLFRVKSGYFLKEDLIELNKPQIKVERIAYRSDYINTAIKTQSELIHLKYIDALLKQYTRKIQFPENKIVKLRDEVIHFLNTTESNITREEQISYVANLARKRLGLDMNNNNNLIYHFEKQGVFIFEKAIGDTIDAYSVWSEDDIPYIVLGNIKKSAVRRNFDLAHELGHLLLHYKTEFNMLNKRSYNQKEDEANIFAARFLMPDDTFREDLSKLNKISNPNAYIELKEKWLVSIQAMGLRARDLGIMSYQQLRYFFMSINKNDYKRKEPLDDIIPLERPNKVRSIFRLLFEEGLLSPSEITESLKIDLEFLSMVTGIELKFFRKYIPERQKIFSKKDLTIKRKV